MATNIVVIVGAGITGLSIARVLSMYRNLEVHVVERNPDVGWGATKANTSIIHPGHEEDPDAHPLRARLCVEGNRIWRRWVAELDIPARWPGELMLIFNEEEAKAAENYIRLARRNGVPGVKILTGDEATKLEGSVSPSVEAALWAPTAGLISPFEAAVAMAENAAENGVRFHFEEEVREIRVRDGAVREVVTNRGRIKADLVINAAGLYADAVSRLAGVDGFEIKPRRGVYFVFSKDAPVKVDKILHPVPTPVSKGVYVVTTVDGNLMVGPSARDVNGKEESETTPEELEYVWSEASRLLARPLPRHMVIKTFAGLRPEPSTGDFIIRSYDDPLGFINVAGIRSPGLTAAPAIAFHVRNLVSELFNLEVKDKWVAERRRIERIADAGPQRRKELLARNPSYGRILCWCEEVSEAEVVEAIERMRMIGVTRLTLDGVKLRTRAMAGDCQGSFCRLRIVLLLSKLAGVEPWRVTLRGAGTEYAIGDVKVLIRGERR